MNYYYSIIEALRPEWPRIASSPPPDHSIKFNHPAWDDIPDWNRLAREFPIGDPNCVGDPCTCSISRSDLNRLAFIAWQRRPGNLRQLKRLFIATMIWGYSKDGKVTNGRWRTDQMLATPNFNNMLKEISDATHEMFFGYAYGLLHRNQKSNISWLGATFATKILYFLATPLGCKVKPLILDKRVSVSLRRLFKKANVPDEYWRHITDTAPVSTNPRWSNAGYFDYLNLMHNVSCGLGVKPDQLELFLWSEAR